ncbi:thiol peroxidase [Methylophilus aquaticus]|uniref:Thiol peroxidase n=1 Tax=Methylophilus aquaticus TaxID=1971610 RepID=A0ABT9JR99_9PROT|nr:thiol peroxidase [Methylophilus aquaticus]MDP8567091.1 thiol peroxidase [Methylophilus aquaticus]
MSGAIKFNEEPILVENDLPQIGQSLPFFLLVNHALEDISLDAFRGKRKIINIFPSIDTPTSAQSVRQLDAIAAGLDNTVVLNVSADLPFAMSRFYDEEKLGHVTNLSTMRGRDMLKNYGVLMVTSKLAGLSARALMVADENDTVLHVELVNDLTSEPDYQAAIASLENT